MNQYYKDGGDEKLKGQIYTVILEYRKTNNVTEIAKTLPESTPVAAWANNPSPNRRKLIAQNNRPILIFIFSSFKL